MKFFQHVNARLENYALKNTAHYYVFSKSHFPYDSLIELTPMNLRVTTFYSSV
jgi:hypothetical protein